MLRSPAWLAVITAACSSGPAPDPAHPRLKPYPSQFLWGTATAPYQVEGNLHDSDWYQWDQSPANPSMQHADDGPDEYDFFDRDFQLAEGMANNAVRLGIDWSRLFPQQASFPSAPDATALAHYHALFASMKAHHLTPMVTLYHKALPTWMQDLTQIDVKSGWLDPGSVQLFAQFVGWAAKEFGGEVDYWVTLNEPMINLVAGYVAALEPPLRHVTDTDGVAHTLQAARDLVYAHAAAYDAIHANDTVDADGDGRSAWVSCAFNQRVFEPPPNNPTPENLAATARLHYLNNLWFLNAVTKGDLDYDMNESLDDPMDKKADPALVNRLDYVGVNYYGPTEVIAFGHTSIGPLTGLPKTNGLDDNRPFTEYGWSIDPPGLRTVLDEAAGYKLPIIITENGIADSMETQRPRFLIDHLYVLQRALQDGLDVRGYFHWTLMDNFEWAGGYCPKFGFFRVDRGSPQKTRIAGKSVPIYKQIIEQRGVDPSLFAQFPDYPDPTIRCSGGGI
jgi:beta-glucosidase